MHVAILVVSDTRTLETDTSGAYLAEQICLSNHSLYARAIVKDNVADIQRMVREWMDSDNVNIILCTGGTGFSGRDSTPEAIVPLFEKSVPGFGELFRWLSYQDIGSSTVQSRACAGMANNTLIIALPGSLKACRLAWEKIISEQLNPNHQPCNFVDVIDNLRVNKTP